MQFIDETMATPDIIESVLIGISIIMERWEQSHDLIVSQVFDTAKELDAEDNFRNFVSLMKHD